MQVGAGIGLVASPLLLSLLLEWEWIFALWAAFALILAWLCLHLSQEEPIQVTPRPAPASIGQRLLAAFRQKKLVLLGLLHLGTLGMGQAVAPWLAVFFGSALFHLSEPVAVGLGAGGLWLGAITRPVGGLLLTYPGWRSHLLRLSGVLAWIGLLVLVYCPTFLLLLFAGQAPPVAHVAVSLLGLLLAVAGWTLPYSSVFSHADRIGQKLSLGRGTAQSVAMLLSAPASAFGPTVIGWLHGHAAGFPSIFAVLAWIQLGILVIAFLLEPSLLRAGSRSARKRTRRLSPTWASA
jgi:hypothetical protein